jgi:hypothetical protein
MKTLVNNKNRKVKSIEVQYSNMTFQVLIYCDYIIGRKKAGWSNNSYTAIIKETNKIGVSSYPSLKSIKKEMELINSKPELFL